MNKFRTDGIIIAKDYDLFKLLVDNGLDLTRLVDGSSLIKTALSYDRFEVVDLFREIRN